MILTGGITARLDWYDRNSAPKLYWWQDDLEGPHALTERLIYTVGVGKKAIVEDVYIRGVRQVVSGGGPRIVLFISIENTEFGKVFLRYNEFDNDVVGDEFIIKFNGELLLQTGAIIRVETQDTSAGGNARYSASISVNEFIA